MTIRLEYRLNTHTGLPELLDRDHVLDAAEFDDLAEELERNIPRLQDMDRRVCRFRSRSRVAPAGRYLVRVLHDTPRMPTLVLIPRSHRSSASGKDSDDAPAWVDSLLKELNEIMATGWLVEDEAGKDTLAFEQVVAELGRMARKQPEQLAGVLLTGFLTVSREAAAGDPGRETVHRLALKHFRRLSSAGRTPRAAASAVAEGSQDLLK